MGQEIEITPSTEQRLILAVNPDYRNGWNAAVRYANREFDRLNRLLVRERVHNQELLRRLRIAQDGKKA